MKRRWMSIFIIMTMSILLIGCSSKVGKEAVEQGKLAMAQKEYDKALGSFKLAEDEGIKDEDVRNLVQILDTYIQSNKLFEEGKLSQAQELIGKINENYINYDIKDDVDELKTKITESEDLIKKYDEILILIEEGSLEEAKVKFGEIQSISSTIPAIESKKTEIESKISEKEKENAEKEAAEEKKQAEKKAKEKANSNKPEERARRALLEYLNSPNDIKIIYIPGENFYGSSPDPGSPVIDYGFRVEYKSSGAFIANYYVNADTHEVIDMDYAKNNSN